jgi:hypothetical protein
MAVDRKSALCDQDALTGIDFIQVVEPQVQTVLRIFFMVEPSALLPVPMGSSSLAAPPGAGSNAGPLQDEPSIAVTIRSTETGEAVRVEARGWRRVRAPAGIRLALEVEVAAPGDFSLHSLTIEDARVDPFFNDRVFSFKQGCPSVFDCRVPCDPDPAGGPDHPVDYLARDFHSFRRALLDFAAERYPGWSEPLEADQAVMLMEIMAALGDEFAYSQDRIARELALDSATQRRSRSALARLVDYAPDPGSAATAELAVAVRAGAGGAFADAGARIWALPEGRPPIPFSVRAAPPWHHEAWNEIPLHQPDSDVACLPEGATEAFLATAAPIAPQLPPGAAGAAEDFWIGRRAILRFRPATGPMRAFAITIRRVSRLVDQLGPSGPVPLVRIGWDEPIPWPMPLAGSHALLNIVTVVAGEMLIESFRIGSDEEVLARYPLASAAEVAALPRAVERQGPFDDREGARGLILRYGLRGSESLGLGWEGARDPLGIGSASAQTPMLALAERPTTPSGAATPWRFRRDLLTAAADMPAFTLEEGMWRIVASHQTPFGDFAFQDYAGDQGWTLRFGDGAFGRRPQPGAIFEAAYFTAPGAAANLAADTLTRLDPPPGAPPGPTFAYAGAATNPLAIADGTDEEGAADIRINAPEAWRALPLRAVRPEDYQSIIERLGWVQRANATTAWTGSWQTDFVAADPLAGIGYTAEQRAALEDKVDCIRLATRDARLADPDYLDIDLEIDLCVAAGAYPGEVVPRVLRALAPPGFFAAANFTFGQPLRRSALESAIQAVPGVKGVEAISLRVRRAGDWERFADADLAVAPGQIVRMENDPLFPSRGSLRVTGHGGAS